MIVRNLFNKLLLPVLFLLSGPTGVAVAQDFDDTPSYPTSFKSGSVQDKIVKIHLCRFFANNLPRCLVHFCLAFSKYMCSQNELTKNP